MKKVYALLMAAVLLFLLASCSIGDGEVPEGSMSKKDMLKNTVSAPVSEISDAKAENIGKAENTYCGKVYSFTGHVDKIEKDHIELIPYGSYDAVIAYMAEKDILTLSENELINIVGEIGRLDCGDSVLAELTYSYYVDNEVKIHGWISNIEKTENGGYTACITDLPYSNNKKVVWRFDLDSAEKTGADSSNNDVLRGKCGNTYLYNGTFVTIKCNASFTYFDPDPSAKAQGSQSDIQIDKIVNLSVD